MRPLVGKLRSRSNFAIAALVASSNIPDALIWPWPYSASARCTAAIRGDGPISSAIASLRRAATGSGTGAVATGRAGVPVISGLSESLLAADDFVFMNGGVCMLDCRKMAFATMIRAVVTAATMAIASTGRRTIGSHSDGPNAVAPLTTRARKDRCRRLGTPDASPLELHDGGKARLSER